MSNPWKQIEALWEMRRALRRKPAAIAARQQTFVRTFVRFARHASPYYQRLYARVPESVQELSDLPVVSKGDLMAHFDEWVTDRAVTRTGVELFLADKTRIGYDFRGRYLLYTSSGSTGEQALFVQDKDALICYRTLNILSMGWSTLRAVMRAGGRWVMIAASTQEHLGSTSAFKLLERIPVLKLLFKQVRILSMTVPLAELVRELNAYQPHALIGYSALVSQLAEEQLAGRLQIHPLLIGTGSEWIPREEHARIRTTFQCAVHDVYAAAECPSIAFSCDQGYMHSYSDRVILEAVDKDYQPVRPGQQSYTVLLSNLINRVQPVIRYDLSDSVTLLPGRCPCGNPFPAFHLDGRKNDPLILNGKTIFPGVAIEMFNHLPGVERFQVVQTGSDRLKVRLQVRAAFESAQVWETALGHLQELLAAEGVGPVHLERSPEPPLTDPLTGKYRYVAIDMAASEQHTPDLSLQPGSAPG
jgi:phenylacetate-coenzyme A ligase PaaK-like adenylate-forming protein